MIEKQEPFVSVCCITYNQEAYIGDAIDSFLKQETTFPFEIIVHDDASTDGTADVVREYEARHPDLIRSILQTENQFSKGVMVPFINTLRYAQGKYIALCEGDDYWTDPSKLQKQITEMEDHPDCYMSFHPAVLNWNDGARAAQVVNAYSEIIKVFSIEEVIVGGGSFIPSASIVLRDQVIPRIISFFDLSKKPPCGDYYMQILGAERGGALFLKDAMSGYRKNVPGSFSEKTVQDSEFQRVWATTYIDTFGEIDAFTGYKYSRQFAVAKRNFVLDILLSGDYDRAAQEEILRHYRNAGDDRLWGAALGSPVLIRLLKMLKSVRHRVKGIPNCRSPE